MMNVVQLNYVFDAALADPDALLAHYPTLTGWSDALAAAGGARVTVVQRFGRDARITRNGIDYLFCRDGGSPRPRSWTWLRRLFRTVVGAAPDVIHINGLIVPRQTWLLRRMLPERVPIVVQDHGGGLTVPRALFRHVLRRHALRVADGFLFATEEQADLWRHAGLIAVDQRIYAVMEASTGFRPMSRSEGRRASGLEGAPSLLWVGRLNPNKDPLTVLDGFEQSITRLPGAILTMIYSADGLLPEVRARVEGSSILRERVRLVGKVPHESMPAFYSAADLFVLGSHHEGSGYALLEACACGLVPVVTDIPSFRAITADGSLGTLWAPGDAAGFARALAEAAASDLRAGRSQVIKYFNRALSWAAIGRHAIAAYRDAVARRTTWP